MDKFEELLREIYSDYKRGYSYMDYDFHNDELGYDEYNFILDRRTIIVTRYIYGDDGDYSGSSKFEIANETFEEFEKKVDSAIYYMPMELRDYNY